MTSGNSWRVVHIEDSEVQATVVRCILEKAFRDEDFVYVNDKTLKGAIGHLDQGCLDIVIVDLGLPDAKGPEAVAAVRKVCPEAPIIVLTGEDSLAVGKACVRAGADYYLLKAEVASLPLAIMAAVERWDLRREKKVAADRYASIVEESPDWIVRFTNTGIVTFANKTMLDGMHMAPDDIIGKPLGMFLDLEQSVRHNQVVQRLTPASPHVDGNDFWIHGRLIHWRKSGIFDKSGRLVEIQSIGKDITADHELLQQLRKDVAKIGTKVAEKTSLLLDNAEAKLKETLNGM